MKKILMAILAIAMLSIPAWAAEDKPVTYEVTIEVTYNAVSQLEAAEIARKALARHGDKACKVDVGVRKNGNRDAVITGATARDLIWVGPDTVTTDITR